MNEIPLLFLFGLILCFAFAILVFAAMLIGFAEVVRDIVYHGPWKTIRCLGRAILHLFTGF